MSTRYVLSLLCCIFLLTGCRDHGILAKRESELNCPTDIRKMIPWCAGEDSIFRCPCGPNEQFHGHKPTCWRLWQTSGAEWRDLHCESLCSQCETDILRELPALQLTQPSEVIPPTRVAPEMPLPENDRQEAAPQTVAPSSVNEESLPEPNGDSIPLGVTIPANPSSDRLQLPWEHELAKSPVKSLTDYCHLVREHHDLVAGDLATGMQLSKPKSEPTQQDDTESHLAEQLAELPPVQEINDSDNSGGIMHQVEVPEEEMFSELSSGQSQSCQHTSDNRQANQIELIDVSPVPETNSTGTSFRIIRSNPPQPEAAELDNDIKIISEKLPESTRLSENQDILQIKGHTETDLPVKSQANSATNITCEDLNQNTRCYPTRQATSVFSPTYKGSLTSGMKFVR